MQRLQANGAKMHEDMLKKHLANFFSQYFCQVQD